MGSYLESNPGIVLERNSPTFGMIIIALVSKPCLPFVATFIDRRQSLGCQFFGNGRLALQNLQCEAGRCVPGDMAMQQPGTWVVCFERDDDKSIGGKKHNVTAGRVVIIRIKKLIPVLLVGLLEQCEIMTMQVNRFFKSAVNSQLFGNRNLLGEQQEQGFADLYLDHACWRWWSCKSKNLLGSPSEWLPNPDSMASCY